MSITLSDEQNGALEAVVDWASKLKPGKKAKSFTLGGIAGSGKSTLINPLRHRLEERLSFFNTSAVAFTNKATRVLHSKNIPDASTIHMLMYKQVSMDPIRFEKKQFLTTEFVIVDEASMAGRKLRNDLESYGVPVLYIGDPFQLPPVNDEDCMVKCDYMLREQRRSDDYIASIANIVRTKKVWKRTIDRAKIDLNSYDQVLCWRNNTRYNLNRQMRGGDHPPRVGDKVIILKTDHKLGLCNGDIGMIASLSPLVVDFDGIFYTLPRPHFLQRDENPYDRDFMGRQVLDFGYAITVHKSQGSQFDKVLLWDECDNPRLVYTAITRAVKLIDIA